MNQAPTDKSSPYIGKGATMIKIKINNELCTNPLECRKCIDACPESVFFTYPKKPRARGKKAEDWVIFPALTRQCTACNLCVEQCPEKAIEISGA